MKLSELLKRNNTKEFLYSQLFAFFNIRVEDKENINNLQYFHIRSSYNKSKFTQFNLSTHSQLTNHGLISFSKLDFKITGKVKHEIEIENDLKLSLDDIYNKLYKNIQNYLFSNELSEDEIEKIFLIAIFGLNGSADFSGNYYAVDINKNILTNNYFIKYYKLILNINFDYINLNFRDLQPEFVNGIAMRSTQFRVNLNYFYNTAKDELKKLNPYKYEILENNKNKIKPFAKTSKKDTNKMLERFDFYGRFILGKKGIDINELRKRLEFDKEVLEKATTKRKQNIITIARNYLDDECVGCKGVYDINDRTFKTRAGIYYLEIHHVIPFAKGNTDELDNLVKLCPACHRALTPNRAEENYQKEIIKNILENSKESKEFSKNISSYDGDELIEYIYSSLR
ncbi:MULTISPECIES: HNH endonuclease [unclassified Campylobacter]|uniref:HNH endonuclease n=1 Tax=unclassified Campylobacter TaxID=2593542 RepID=UPI00301474F6